jgi:6-phosphofructokinase 2
MKAPSIVTLTMNPAIDLSAAVDRVVADRKLRCGEPVREAGGGGINVARAVRRLGGEALALFPAGGPAGDLLKQLLFGEGVPFVAIRTDGWTRENVNVSERETGKQFRFVLPGPSLEAAEWERCLETLSELEPFPRLLVASGSLPPGVPPDFYARVARLVRSAGSRMILDTSGKPLRLAARQGVFLLKPSLREFEELTRSSLPARAALVDRARELVRDGRCEVLVLSLGPEGVLWVSASEAEWMRAPAVSVASSVGAGDSLVAGIVLGLSRGKPVREAVRLGLAAATASVMTPGTGLCRLDDVERLARAIRGSELGAPIDANGLLPELRARVK